MPDQNTADALRQWARGDLGLEAAVELLVTACGDALLDGPWIRHEDQLRPWFDPDLAEAEAGHLSGGQRRVLAIATSLASRNHPVDLGDAVTGIDPRALQCVMSALTHAGGLAVSFIESGGGHDEPR